MQHNHDVNDKKRKWKPLLYRKIIFFEKKNMNAHDKVVTPIVDQISICNRYEKESQIHLMVIFNYFYVFWKYD